MTNIPADRPSSERLALLYHLAQAFNSSLDLDQVLNRVIDEVIIATHAERGFVMLRESDGRLVFRVARGIDQQTIDDPAFQVSRSVVEKVALDGQPILTYDAQTDSRFAMRQSVMILGLRSILCVPLINKNAILGVVYVDNRLQAGIFSQTDLELVMAIASNAAIAIDNARLYQLAVEKGRLERELQMARQVQVSLLPVTRPEIPGWEFVARWLPARQVSGDYYDFFQFSDDRLGLLIADVSDKGMPAALFMALTRSIVRASMDQSTSPSKGIERANRLISSDAANGMFVTMFYGLINAPYGELTFVNAGHNPPLLYRCGTDNRLAVQNTTAGKNSQQDNPDIGQLTFLTKTGMALGIMDDNHYDQHVIHLNRGDFVVMYTDGVTDAQTPQGKPFGMERLQRVVMKHSCDTAEQIVAALESALATFTENLDPIDDITLLVIRRT